MRKLLLLPLLLVPVVGIYASAAPSAEPGDEPQHQRYQRSVTLLPAPSRSAPSRSVPGQSVSGQSESGQSESGQYCTILDAPIFPNAAPSLKDLRLYQQSAGSANGGQPGREIPYAITLSEPAQPDADPARVLNLGMRGHTIVFDLAMPARPYTDVLLDLAGQNYIATATVSGSAASAAATSTRLGEFTLFDLTSQHLSHSTTLHLQESTFANLHVELSVSPAPGASGFTATPHMVLSASVPPSREAQSLFTVSAETTALTQRGKQTIATFVVPTRVPVERVSFQLSPAFQGNFSRDVQVSERPEGQPDAAAITARGTILRVHLTEAGREIRQQQLSLPATIGSNLQGPATVQVAIDNGDDAPLPITSVRLEMRQRMLCFDTAAAPSPTLFYGDAALPAPEYDYARIFSAANTTHFAMLGPQQFNAGYRPRQDTRPLTERHPDTLWIALLVVISLLALVAFRSTRQLQR